MSLRHENLNLDELLKYGEDGAVPGIHPDVAKQIREELEAGAVLKTGGKSITDLEEEISDLNEKLDEVKRIVE